MSDTRPNNMRLRLPRGLDAHLHELADAQGVPVTNLVTVLLAQASKWEPVPDPEPDPTEARS